MKKTISGVLLALTATCALVACGKKKDKERKRSGKPNIINFYCWNSEFQERLNRFYGGQEDTTPDETDASKKVWRGKNIDKVNGSTTVLKNGITIQWTTATNQGSIYQDTLDIALDNNIVDMFCFEADYATKYVKSEFVIDMATLGVNQGDQFQYTKDIVTKDGKLVGSSWQACPGVIIYNNAIAEDVFGAGVTTAQMEEKIGKDYATFKTSAASVKAKNYNMVVGPASIYRLYAQNLSAKMYDGKDTITIDKSVFEYAVNSKELSGYMAGLTEAYGQWSENWGKEMSKDGKTLCVFGCPWFVDFSFKGYRDLKESEGTDSGWRVCKPYKSFFWGGTWLTATTVSQQEDTIKGEIGKIISAMTTDKATLKDITAATKDFTNTKTGMGELKDNEDAYFGNAKVIAAYLESVKTADMSKSSDFDQQIAEGFQASFRTYIDGSAKADACWADFVSNLKDKTSVKNVKAAAGVTINADGITIA